MKKALGILACSTLLVGFGDKVAMANGALSGFYRVQSNNCSSLLAVGQTIEISATASAFTYGVEASAPGGQTGLETLLSVNIGTYTSSGQGATSGGQQVENQAGYSSDGSSFVYIQTFLVGPVQPFSEITREVQVIKNGNTVSLQDNESATGAFGPACILSAE